jgi:hypothetical protein
LTLYSYHGICVPVLFSFGIGYHVDWDLVIKRNSEALKGIIDDLFAMLGLDDDTTVSRISHPLIAPCCGCSVRLNPPCGA